MPALPAREAAGNRPLVSANVIFIHGIFIYLEISSDSVSDSHPSFSSCPLRGYNVYNQSEGTDHSHWNSNQSEATDHSRWNSCQIRTIAPYPERKRSQQRTGHCDATIIGRSYFKLLAKYLEYIFTLQSDPILLNP